MSEIAITVSKVSKSFKLPHEKQSSLKSLFVNFFRRKKGYELQQTLKDISFEVKKGEFFGIVGRNGSGKSTLLKIIAGIYQPTQGNVGVNGKLVPFIELGVGFNPELTGRENVYLNGALFGFSNKEIGRMYKDIVEFAELDRFMDQKLKNYSSGMQVRLAFSMAVRAKADVLLIDEVLAVGDTDFQRKCYEYFQRIKSQGTTVIFVTHDMMAVRQYCDRVAVIESSALIDINDPESAAKEYMKLFSGEKNNPVSDKRSSRWGDKKAIYDNVKVVLVDNQKSVSLSVTVRAKQDIADPTYGIMISNEAKQPILGTNSKIENVPVKSLKANQQVTLNWKIPNIFNEGKYFVELVLMYNSVTEVADWWENAKSFSITNEKRTPYIVNPPTEFSIK